MSDETVSVKFGAETGEAEAGIESVKRKIEEIGESVRSPIARMQELQEAVAEAFAVEKIGEFVERLVELGEQALRSSAMLGMSVESVQKLGFAAQMAGGNADGMAMALGRFERNVATAQSGAGKAYETFTNLGISLKDLKSLSPEELLGKVADRFAETEDGAVKYAYAVELGGRSWGEMIPLLDKGSDGLRQVGMIAEQTGSILSKEQAEGLEKTAQGLTTLKASVEGAALAMFESFEPAIDDVIAAMTLIVQGFTAAIGILHEFQIVLGADLVIACGFFVRAIEDLGVQTRLVADKIMIRWKELGAYLTALATGQWGLLKDVAAEADAEIAAATKKATAAIIEQQQAFDKLKSSAEGAAGALLAHKEEPAEAHKASLPPVPTGSKAAKEDDNADLDYEKEVAETKLKLAKLGLQGQKDMLDDELAANRITQQQKIAALESYTTLEYQLSRDALAKELALYERDEVEYQQVLDKKQILDAQYANEQSRLAAQSSQANKKSTQDMWKNYQGIAGTIGRDFDSMLTGILQGTQTISQAMTKMFEDMAISAVEALAKILVEWLLFEVATEGEGSWSDFVAIQGGGKSGAGFLSGLPSFDVGSYNIPGDTMAMVHKGEMIIPAAQASQVRTGGGLGGGSGGDNYHITIQAIDTQTGAQFIKANAGHIVKALSGQARNGNPNLMKAS